MNEIFDLVSVGDCSLDSFITPSEAESMCELDTHRSYVCLSFGDKIPVESLEFCVGGNASNNAVGLTRLGLKTAIVSTVGIDVLGKEIIEVLAAEGVTLDHLNKTTSKSNFSTIINYSGERTILSYHARKEYVFPKNFPNTKWVYLTSMGDGYEAFVDKLLEWLRANPNTNLAVNPGSKQLRDLGSSLKMVLNRTSVLYVNREEAEKITSMSKTVGREKELLEALASTGPKVVVITDGPGGAYVFNRQGYFFSPIFPTQVIERTGAGDGYGSAMLAAIIKGKTLEEALLWGALNSASVVGQTGAQKGLLRENEIEQWVIKAHELGVKVTAL